MTTTGTVATTSNPAIGSSGSCRRRPPRAPARAAASCSPECSGDRKMREPAVGDLAREPEVARADGSEVDGRSGAGRADREPQRLAGAVGQRQRVVLPGIPHLLAPQRHPHDLDVLAGAAERGARTRTPCQPSLTCGPETPRPRWNRPAGEGVERRGGHRRHRRGARRDLHDPGAEPDRRSSAPPARRARSGRRTRRPRRPRPARSRGARPRGRARGCPSPSPMPA